MIDVRDKDVLDMSVLCTRIILDLKYMYRNWKERYLSKIFYYLHFLSVILYKLYQILIDLLNIK